jgi:2-phospho-L-lactate guanylyltransferase
MKIVAVVPIKALDAAKTRLGAVLDADDRADLTLWLAGRVVTAIAASGIVERTIVVSPDAEVLRWAAGRGHATIRQRAGDLNAGIALGRDWALAAGAGTLLVALGDLPLLTPEDVRALADRACAASNAARGPAAGVAVVASDRAGTGTNLLLVAPPGALAPAFGPGSRARHEALAHAHGLRLDVYSAPGTAFDVDQPADLDELRSRGLWAPRSAAALDGANGTNRAHGTHGETHPASEIGVGRHGGTRDGRDP